LIDEKKGVQAFEKKKKVLGGGGGGEKEKLSAAKGVRRRLPNVAGKRLKKEKKKVQTRGFVRAALCASFRKEVERGNLGGMETRLPARLEKALKLENRATKKRDSALPKFLRVGMKGFKWVVEKVSKTTKKSDEV